MEAMPFRRGNLKHDWSRLVKPRQWTIRLGLLRFSKQLLNELIGPLGLTAIILDVVLDKRFFDRRLYDIESKNGDWEADEQACHQTQQRTNQTAAQILKVLTERHARIGENVLGIVMARGIAFAVIHWTTCYGRDTKAS